MFSRRAWMLVLGLVCLFGSLSQVHAATTSATTWTVFLPLVVQPGQPAAQLPADWLPRLNGYRAAAGLGPVAEDPSFTVGDALHVNYMLLNSNLPLQHSENMALPGATLAGDTAARESNLFAGSMSAGVQAWTTAQAIDGWMESLSHRYGMLRPHLSTAGFAMGCSAVYCGAALNVIGGLNGSIIHTPVVYPGVNQQQVTTNYISWQAYDWDSSVSLVGAAFFDQQGHAVAFQPVAGYPKTGFNMVALKPAMALAPNTTYTVWMNVQQGATTTAKSWSFTTK